MGTRVPMVLVHPKALKLNGNNPTLLTGYGLRFQIRRRFSNGLRFFHRYVRKSL